MIDKLAFCRLLRQLYRNSGNMKGFLLIRNLLPNSEAEKFIQFRPKCSKNSATLGNTQYVEAEREINTLIIISTTKPRFELDYTKKRISCQDYFRYDNHYAEKWPSYTITIELSIKSKEKNNRLEQVGLFQTKH